jgi:hypothetical protein
MYVMMRIDCSNLQTTQELQDHFPLPQELSQELQSAHEADNHYLVKFFLCMVQYHDASDAFKRQHKLKGVTFGQRNTTNKTIIPAILTFGRECTNALIHHTKVGAVWSLFFHPLYVSMLLSLCYSGCGLPVTQSRKHCQQTPVLQNPADKRWNWQYCHEVIVQREGSCCGPGRSERCAAWHWQGR